MERCIFRLPVMGTILLGGRRTPESLQELPKARAAPEGIVFVLGKLLAWRSRTAIQSVLSG
ncbi:hypothetical protein D3C75_1171360 [compost metagenome]